MKNRLPLEKQEEVLLRLTMEKEFREYYYSLKEIELPFEHKDIQHQSIAIEELLFNDVKGNIPLFAAKEFNASKEIFIGYRRNFPYRSKQKLEEYARLLGYTMYQCLQQPPFQETEKILQNLIETYSHILSSIKLSRWKDIFEDNNFSKTKFQINPTTVFYKKKIGLKHQLYVCFYQPGETELSIAKIENNLYKKVVSLAGGSFTKKKFVFLYSEESKGVEMFNRLKENGFIL